MTIYQEELKRRLKEQGFGAVYDEQTEMLKFYHNGIFLGEQSKSGALHYDGDIYKLQNCGYLTKEISALATETNQCITLYEKGEPMKPDAVSNYRKFLEHGIRCLRAHTIKNAVSNLRLGIKMRTERILYTGIIWIVMKKRKKILLSARGLSIRIKYLPPTKRNSSSRA